MLTHGGPKLLVAAVEAGNSLACGALPRPNSLYRRRRHLTSGEAGPRAGFNNSSSSGSSGGRRPEADKVLHALSSPGRERIGAEYGEGFTQFRLSGEKTRLDVDTLNEQLQASGAARIRQSMCPDEAYGLIICWEHVVANTRDLQRAAWLRLAEEEGLPPPGAERPIYDVRPERVITEVLGWTQDWGRAQELAWRLAGAYSAALLELAAPLPGVQEWLDLVSRNNVPAALVTTMDRTTAHALLDRLGLRHFFAATVTADDDMETISERFLSAAIKLGRPPNQCVVFSGCPAAVTAAHNCTMRAVALQGAHRAYQLRNADLTIASLADLTVYNLRRLFANNGLHHMDLSQDRVGSTPPRRRLTHALAEVPEAGET